MNGPEIMMSVAADIEQQLHSFEERPSAILPSTISPALAVALLQKSIRRGRSHLAQAAAMFLLQVAPDRLWRRLTIVAFEDVGVADLDGLYLTTVAASHRRRLAAQFGAQRLVGLIVARLASAPKCRAADDLHVVAHDFPGSANLYSEFQQLRLGDLLSV